MCLVLLQLVPQQLVPQQLVPLQLVPLQLVPQQLQACKFCPAAYVVGSPPAQMSFARD